MTTFMAEQLDRQIKLLIRQESRGEKPSPQLALWYLAGKYQTTEAEIEARKAELTPKDHE